MCQSMILTGHLLGRDLSHGTKQFGKAVLKLVYKLSSNHEEGLYLQSSRLFLYGQLSS